MKKFKNIIGNINDWNTKVLTPLKEFYGDSIPEFLDDTKTFYKQNQICKLFQMNYNELVVRYESEQLFLNALILSLMDNLPRLYVSSLAFVNDEFQKLLQDENRGIKVTENINSLSKSKNKQGVPPTNLTVSDDLRNLNIKNAEYLENALDNQHVTTNTNLLMNLKGIISSNINGIVLDWLKNFIYLFSTLISNEIDEVVRDNLQDEFYTIKSDFNQVTTDVKSLSDKVDNLNNLINDNSEEDKSLAQKVIANTTSINDLSSKMVDLNNNQTINGTKQFNNQTVFANNNTLVKVGKGGYQNTMTGIEFSNTGTIGVWNDSSNQLQISTFTDGVRFNTKVLSTVEPTESRSLTTKNYVDSQVSNFNSTLTTTKNNLQNSINNNTTSINTLNNWCYYGDSCIGFYMDGQIASINAVSKINDNLYVYQFNSNITYRKDFVNAACVAVCLRAYNELSSFSPIELWRNSSNSISFNLLCAPNKAINGQNVRIFLVKNKYW